jgi:hypothetical protein
MIADSTATAPAHPQITRMTQISNCNSGLSPRRKGAKNGKELQQRFLWTAGVRGYGSDSQNKTLQLPFPWLFFAPLRLSERR